VIFDECPTWAIGYGKTSANTILLSANVVKKRWKSKSMPIDAAEMLCKDEAAPCPQNS
jgi:hypothetical protein